MSKIILTARDISLYFIGVIWNLLIIIFWDNFLKYFVRHKRKQNVKYFYPEKTDTVYPPEQPDFNKWSEHIFSERNKR